METNNKKQSLARFLPAYNTATMAFTVNAQSQHNYDSNIL